MLNFSLSILIMLLLLLLFPFLFFFHHFTKSRVSILIRTSWTWKMFSLFDDLEVKLEIWIDNHNCWGVIENSSIISQTAYASDSPFFIVFESSVNNLVSKASHWKMIILEHLFNNFLMKSITESFFWHRPNEGVIFLAQSGPDQIACQTLFRCLNWPCDSVDLFNVF